MKYRKTAKMNTDQVLKFYVTSADYEKLMMEYSASDLPSISCFLRKKVVGHGIIIPDASSIKDKLDGIGYKYERIGNNINQIARKVNLYHKKGHFPAHELNNYNETMKRFLRVTEELSRSFRVFLRELARK